MMKNKTKNGNPIFHRWLKIEPLFSIYVSQSVLDKSRDYEGSVSL